MHSHLQNTYMYTYKFINKHTYKNVYNFIEVINY